MIELNRIYNEDCLEGMKRIPDKSIDMILCDLPYGTTACKWDTVIPLNHCGNSIIGLSKTMEQSYCLVVNHLVVLYE